MAIKKYLKIYSHLIKFSAMTEMEYRFSFLLEWLVEFFYIIASFFSIQVLFWNIKEVAGWDFNEMLVLLGVNALFSEIILGVVFVFNLRTLPRKIMRGDLDLFLTKPISSQFVASLWRPYFALLPSLFPGLCMIYLGFKGGNFSFSLVGILFFLIMFILGLIMSYSIGMIIATFAFWLIDSSDPLPRLAEKVLQMSGNPFSIYQGLWKIIFLMVLPLAFMVTFPSMAILGSLSLWWLVPAIILSLFFLKLSNIFWNFGLKYYQSASS